VQGHDRRGRLGCILRNQHKRGDTDIWSGIEVDLLADILATIHLFHCFRPRILLRRRIVQQLQQLSASHFFPARYRLVFLTQVRELEILGSLTLDEWKEGTYVRIGCDRRQVGSCSASRGLGSSRGLTCQEGLGSQSRDSRLQKVSAGATGCLCSFASHSIPSYRQSSFHDGYSLNLNQKVCDGQRRHPNSGTCGLVGTPGKNSLRIVPSESASAGLSFTTSRRKATTSAKLPPAASTACAILKGLRGLLHQTIATDKSLFRIPCRLAGDVDRFLSCVAITCANPCGTLGKSVSGLIGSLGITE